MCQMVQAIQRNAHTMARVGAEDVAGQGHLERNGTHVIAEVGADVWACVCGCGCVPGCEGVEEGGGVSVACLVKVREAGERTHGQNQGDAAEEQNAGKNAVPHRHPGGVI